MTRDAARPIAALERKKREVTGVAFKARGHAAHDGYFSTGGQHRSTRMIHFMLEYGKGRASAYVGLRLDQPLPPAAARVCRLFGHGFHWVRGLRLMLRLRFGGCRLR